MLIFFDPSISPVKNDKIEGQGHRTKWVDLGSILSQTSNPLP